MNDSYAEWLVKRKNPAYNIVLKAALVLLCAISLVLALVTPFGIIILTVVGIASYFAFQSLSQEFEYLVVNDQITIDRVLGKARRKKGWEGFSGRCPDHRTGGCLSGKRSGQARH